MDLAVGDLNLTYNNTQGTTPVQLILNTLEFGIPSKETISLQANGRVLEEDFSLSFKGASLKNFLNLNLWPVELKLVAAGAEVQVEGTVNPPLLAAGTELNFKVSGEDIGELEKWTGLAAQTPLPYAVSGTFVRSSDSLTVRSIDASLGKSRVSGSVAMNTGQADPLYSLNLDLNSLDIDELSTGFASSETTEEPAASPEQEQKIDLRMPILPVNLALPDIDFSVSVPRLATGEVQVEDIALSGQFRDGRLEQSPFQAVFGGTLFQGNLAFDPTKRLPKFDLSLFTGKIDVGIFLENLGVAEMIPVHAERVQLDLMLKGRRLGGLLKRFELSAQVINGSWQPDSNDAIPFPLVFDKVLLEIKPDQPIRLIQDITVRGVPIKVEATTQRLADFKERSKQNFGAKIKTGETVLDLKGAFSLPVRKNELEVKVSLSGKRFDELNKLLEAELPAWGPFQIDGGVQMEEKFISLSDLSMQVGDSRMTGRASLDWRSDRPSADVKLVARQIQLDDFQLKGVGSEEPESASTSAGQDKSEQAEPDTISEPTSKEKTAKAKEKSESIDVRFDFRIKEVLSGEERLGDGIIQVELKDGLLSVHPFSINLPGGSFDARYAVNRKDDEFISTFNATIDEFNYGVVARSLKPETEMRGKLSLNVDLTAPTRDAAKFLTLANGQLDIILVPKKFEAGVLDFWSTGLVGALFSHITSTSESLINCAVARFDMEEGVMEHETILIDTTKIRIEGEAEIDFESRELKLKLKPTAKKAQFYSLETPIEIEGKFEDIKVGTATGGLIGTYARFVSSPLFAPLKRIFQKEPPEDGGDVCKQAIQREKAS